MSSILRRKIVFPISSKTMFVLNFFLSSLSSTLFSLFLLTSIKNRIGFRQKKYNVYTYLGKVKYNMYICWGIYLEDEML